MLPKKHRLNRREFKVLFKTGKRIISLYFILIYNLSFGSNEAKFGFIVSSVLSKKAVIRNKLKRRARAIIVKYSKDFISSGKIIFLFKKECLNLSFKELEIEIINNLK